MTAAIALGYVFARQVTDYTISRSNAWYNRPDLKPFPAMVKQDENDLTRRTMEEAQYFSKSGGEGFRSSALFRFFFARDADFTIRENPYAKLHPEDVWDSRKGHYSTYTNNFGQHHQ